MNPEEELKKALSEYTESASEDEKKNRKKSAATMYFKAIASVCDFAIYSKFKKMPDNHTERFRILQEYFEPFYGILNRLFPIYQQTYRSEITAEQLEMMKDGLKKIKRLAGFE